MSDQQNRTEKDMPQATKACPFCGEEILAVAIKCKHCQSMLNETADTILDIPAIVDAAKTQQDIPQQTAVFSPTLDPEETAFDVGANLKRGIESVGGRLVVTNQALHFKSHALNLQKMPLDLRYDEIVGVTKRNNLGFVPNGLELQLKSGESYRLTINKRNEIAAYIESRIK